MPETSSDDGIEQVSRRLREYFRISILLITAFLTALAFISRTDLDVGRVFGNQYVIFGLVTWASSVIFGSLIEMIASASKYDDSLGGTIRTDSRSLDRYANGILVLISLSALLFFLGLFYAGIVQLSSREFAEVAIIGLIFFIILVTYMFFSLTSIFPPAILSIIDYIYGVFDWIAEMIVLSFSVSPVVAHYHAQWMHVADYRILEAIRDSEGDVQPNNLSSRVGRNNRYIRQRCEKLAQVGLLKQNSYFGFGLSDVGERFLKGYLPKHEFMKLNPGNESRR